MVFGIVHCNNFAPVMRSCSDHFRFKDEIRKHGVVCFSSNCAMYVDLPNRVMTVLEAPPRLEVYSIDKNKLYSGGIQTIWCDTYGHD